MDDIFATVLGPIVVLWIGALIFDALDRFLEPQDRGTAEAVVMVLALGFLFHARTRIGVPIGFGQAFSDVWPFLIVSRTTWLLSLVVLGGATLASLASLGRPTSGRSGRLATLGATLLFLSAGDWATMTFAWVLVDVSLARTLSMDRTRQKTLRWTVTLSVAGAVLLGTALLLWQGDGAGVWVDRSGALVAEMSPRIAGLLALAALLRVMPFPLPTWQAASEDDEVSETHPLARMMVSAIPTLLGAYLWARLGQWSVVESVRWMGILPAWGGLVYLVGAVKAWGVRDPDQLIASVHDLAGATVLVGAGLGLPGSWQLLLGVSAVLSITTLFVAWTQCQHLDVFDVRSYWRAVPMLVMLLSVAGMPLTIGFPARAAIYWSVFASKAWVTLFLISMGEALSLSALWRILLDVECVLDPELESRADATLESKETTPTDRRWVRLADWMRRVDWQHETRYGAGAALAIGIVILGIVPGVLTELGLGRWFGLPRLSIWAALLLPVVGAVVLYRSRDRVLDRIESWWPLIRRLLSLHGLYQGIESVLRHVGTLIWGTTLVVEGEGYMAWVVLACLIVLLFIISR